MMMEKLQRRMTGKVAGVKALLAVVMLGLPGASAQAYTGPLSPSIRVAIAPQGQSDNVACSVWQTTPPPGMNGILVRINVPKDSVPKTVLLRTAHGETALDVTNSLPLLGEYETIIDLERTDCATSGTLLVEVEGELEARKATCPGIVLPKASNCTEP